MAIILKNWSPAISDHLDSAKPLTTMQNYSGGSNSVIFMKSRLLLADFFKFEPRAPPTELRSSRPQGQLTADFPEDSQTSETILRNNPDSDKLQQVVKP